MTGHAVGAKGRVLMTDRDREVLDIADKNILENNLHQVAKTSIMQWNDLSGADLIMDEYAKESEERGFDIIVGSDCLYTGMDGVNLLFSTVAHMLKNADSAADEHVLRAKCTSGAVSNTEQNTTDTCDIDYLDPTSLDGGGWMALQENNSDPSQCRSDCTVLPPVFILGYERRLGGADVNMSAMFKTASDMGLEWCLAEDSVIDIFGNETSEQTLFWEQCVLLFTRKKTCR